MLGFKTDIMDDEYRNPKEKQEILVELDNELVRMHEQREKLVKIVKTVDLKSGGKLVVEKLVEKQKEMGEQVADYM